LECGGLTPILQSLRLGGFSPTAANSIAPGFDAIVGTDRNGGISNALYDNLS